MITLTDIEKHLGEFNLTVDDAAFHDGLTIVVGQNGAGKSTLLQLLATALFPDQGEILYNRQTIKRDLPIIRMDIGFLPTGIELYEDMTANKFLSYMCDLKGLRPQTEVPLLLDDFGMRSYEHKKIARLSEGQKQRIGIAQAFLGQPQFVFLDEPLTSLDIAEQKRVLSYISQYSEKRTVVITSHELNEWNGICDAILWMDNGRVDFYGSPELWTSSLPLSVWVGETAAKDLGTIPENNLIRIRIQDNWAKIRLIAKENPDPMVFKEVQPTIEDAYIIRNSLRQLC